MEPMLAPTASLTNDFIDMEPIVAPTAKVAQKLQRTRQLHLETSMQMWNLQSNEKTRAKRKLKGSTPQGSDPKDSPTTTTTTTYTATKSARQARRNGSLEYNPVEPMLAPADLFCSSS